MFLDDFVGFCQKKCFFKFFKGNPFIFAENAHFGGLREHFFSKILDNEEEMYQSG